MSDPLPPDCGAVCQHGSDYHGVGSLHHPGFQTQAFAKHDLTGLKSLVGLIHHIFHVCIPCQSFVPSKSKVFDFFS